MIYKVLRLTPDGYFVSRCSASTRCETCGHTFDRTIYPMGEWTKDEYHAPTCPNRGLWVTTDLSEFPSGFVFDADVDRLIRECDRVYRANAVKLLRFVGAICWHCHKFFKHGGLYLVLGATSHTLLPTCRSCTRQTIASVVGKFSPTTLRIKKNRQWAEYVEAL